MRTTLHLFLTLCALLASAAPLAAAASDDDDEEGAAATLAPAKADVAYGTDARQKLDLWLPTGASADKPVPVVVYVHGGGWQRGDKRHVGTAPAWALGQGWAFASVEYRVSPAVQHPAHAQDVAAGIGWLVSNGPALGIDAKRIGLFGHSAGAHLAALVGVSNELQTAANIPWGSICAVGTLDAGVLDLPASMAQAKGRMKTMYEQAFGKDPTLWPSASPMAQIATGQKYPPMMLISVASRKASTAAAQAMAARVQAVGGTATALPVDAASHTDINRRFGTTSDSGQTAAMTALFSAAFAPAAAAPAAAPRPTP